MTNFRSSVTLEGDHFGAAATHRDPAYPGSVAVMLHVDGSGLKSRRHSVLRPRVDKSKEEWAAEIFGNTGAWHKDHGHD